MWSEQQAVGGPTEIVATTWFVAGSMRETLGPLVPAPWLVTQTAPGEAGDPVRFLADGNHRGHLARLRIDPRDDIVSAHGHPHGAVACGHLSAGVRGGRAGIGGLDLDPGRDDILVRIDSHQRPLAPAQRPDRTLTDREPARALRDRDLRDDLGAGPDDLGRSRCRSARRNRADHGDCARECRARSGDSTHCPHVSSSTVMRDNSIEAGASARHIGDFPEAGVRSREYPEVPVGAQRVGWMRRMRPSPSSTQRESNPTARWIGWPPIGSLATT